jgi:hypothetical protein
MKNIIYTIKERSVDDNDDYWGETLFADNSDKPHFRQE